MALSSVAGWVATHGGHTLQSAAWGFGTLRTYPSVTGVPSSLRIYELLSHCFLDVTAQGPGGQCLPCFV